jgi:predicted transcriptional regulator
MIAVMRHIGSRFGIRRTVLDALAEVGPQGMTSNALEVSTELPESRLKVVVARLIDAGLVCRRRRKPSAGAVNYLQQEDLLLLTEYARTRP